MLWCTVMNMWCKDMDDEDKAMCCCDGRCRGCENVAEVGIDFGSCLLYTSLISPWHIGLSKDDLLLTDRSFIYKFDTLRSRIDFILSDRQYDIQL